jgi:hypothetical protein
MFTCKASLINSGIDEWMLPYYSSEWIIILFLSFKKHTHAYVMKNCWEIFLPKWVYKQTSIQ